MSEEERLDLVEDLNDLPLWLVNIFLFGSESSVDISSITPASDIIRPASPSSIYTSGLKSVRQRNNGQLPPPLIIPSVKL